MEASIAELLSALSETPAGEGPLLAVAALDDCSSLVTALSRRQHEPFSNSLLSCVSALPPDGADAARRAAANLVLARLEDKKAPTPSPLLETALTLHASLPSVTNGPARNAIIRVCESFWSDGREGRGSLIPNAAVALLERSLAVESGGTSSAADVRRLYALRDCLCPTPANAPVTQAPTDVSDAVDVNGHPHLRALLLRATTSALFHKVPEGQKFLGRLLATLGMCEDVHAAMIGMLPHVRKSRALACGAVFMYAWKAGGSEFFEPFLQDILRKAVYASTEPLACNLRTVLSSFHVNKKLTGMDHMLYVVYTPVLFRALTEANPFVRKNAAMILADSFPIHDPDASNVELEAALEDQCAKMHMLLSDPVPFVRVVAVEGACRVLGLLWELVPPGTVRRIIDLVSSQLAFDKTSAPVRIAVCDGLRFMLDNYQTHGVLAVALKRLKNLMNDNVERVRLSFLSLLVELKSKRIASARYFDIVPMDDLVLRLAFETPACVSRIMQLLVGSFFPMERKNKGHEQIASIQSRGCTKLLSMSSRGALVFYQNISMYIPPGALVEFCLRLATMATSIEENRDQENQDPRAVSDAAPPADTSPGTRPHRRRKNLRIPPGSNHVSEDHLAVAGKDVSTSKEESAERRQLLLQIIGVVLESIIPSLSKPSNSDILQFVVDMFGGSSLKSMLVEHKSPLKTRVACLRIAGTIPSKHIVPIQKIWKEQLASLPDTLPRSAQMDQQQGDWVAGLLRSGLLWQESESVCSVVASWVDMAVLGSRAASVRSASAKRRRRAGRQEAIGGDSRNRALCALHHVADTLIRDAEIRALFLRSLKEQDSSRSNEKRIPDLSWLSLPGILNRGARTAIDAAVDATVDNSKEKATDEVSDFWLSRCLLSAARLSLLAEGAVESQDSVMRPSVLGVVDITTWIADRVVISSLFSRDDSFAWSVLNIVQSTCADGLALGRVSGKDSKLSLSSLSSSVISYLEEHPAIANENSKDILRFSGSCLSMCHHFLSDIMYQKVSATREADGNENLYKPSMLEARASATGAEGLKDSLNPRDIFEYLSHAFICLKVIATSFVSLEARLKYSYSCRILEIWLLIQRPMFGDKEQLTEEFFRVAQEHLVVSGNTDEAQGPAVTSNCPLRHAIVCLFCGSVIRKQAASHENVHGFMDAIFDCLSGTSLTLLLRDCCTEILDEHDDEDVIPSAFVVRLCTVLESRIAPLISALSDLNSPEDEILDDLKEHEKALVELRQKTSPTASGSTPKDQEEARIEAGADAPAQMTSSPVPVSS